MILYNTFVHISHKHPSPQRGWCCMMKDMKEKELSQKNNTFARPNVDLSTNIDQIWQK